MKAINRLVVLLVFGCNAFAADPLTERLQRGLFEEEANRNLDAAIKEYQSVVTQSDEQRKVIATALFRLGECYRKLGRTSDARAQYQRILRDFSEQEQLVRLSREMTPTAVAATGTEGLGLVENLLAQLRAQLAEQQARYDTLNSLPREKLLQAMPITVNDPSLKELLSQANSADQKLANLTSGPLGPGHPDVVQTREVSKVIQKQIDERIAGILAGMKLQVDGTASQIKALEGELEKVKRGARVPASDSTPMTQAEAEELARVKTLAQNSPDLLTRPAPNSSFDPLQSAAFRGYYNVALFLLNSGMTPQGSSSSPLVIAAEQGHRRIVELLLDKGADIQAVSQNSMTALMTSSLKGYLSVVELLLERKADVNATNYAGLTALHCAAKGGHAALVELLLQRGARANARLLQNHSPANQNDVIAGGSAPLHAASEKGYAAVIRILLTSGANVAVTNFDCQTPLHLAAGTGQTEASALLLEKGADPNQPGPMGETPLTLAVRRGSSAEVELLLKHGANVNRPVTTPPKVDGSSYTTYAIHLASSPAVMKALLAAKPLLEVTNTSRQTAVAIVLRNTPVLELLLQAGANPNVSNGTETVLFTAVRRSESGPVAALLKHGANPNVIAGNNETPYSYASMRCDRLIALDNQDQSITKMCEITRLLKENGANPYLHRQRTIYARRDTGSEYIIFSRGTNDVNRYTLLDTLAAVYQKVENPGRAFNFPDFSRIEIHHMAGSTPMVKVVDVDAILDTGSATNDLWLEWGDSVGIPMRTHSASESWRGLDWKREAWTKCLKRTIRVSVAGSVTNITLIPFFENENMRISSSWPMGASFRLASMLHGWRLLSEKSDGTKVSVTRHWGGVRPERKVFDVTQIRVPNVSYAILPPVSWDNDLWLRDGDVIEVPEKP